MRSTGHEPILFHNVMRVRDGHLDAFKKANRDAVEFVEEHGPQLMVQNFVDEAQMLAHSFQLYPDSAAILAHWELSDPYIRDVMRHCTVERLRIYGEPDDTVLRQLPAMAPADLDWAIVPRHVGFLRRTTAGS